MRIHFNARSLSSGLLAILASTFGISCASELTRTGSSPAYIVIDSVAGASGAEPGRFGNPLLSDVYTIVQQKVGEETVSVPTIFNDLGQVQMRMALKNTITPSAPSVQTQITFTRYHVDFRRTDGRNTQGTDVPYSFDGGVTITVPSEGDVTFAFELVRNQAKLEAPLQNLRNGGGAILISTIAEITFYGRDQVGNEVVATGTLSVNFGDFADPS
jgi:hypothetical protein